MRLTAKDLADVVELLREEGKEPSQEQVEGQLAHIHGGGDFQDLGTVEELLKGDGEAYLDMCAPFFREYPHTEPEGASMALAHPLDGLTAEIAVKQLRGKDWRMALSDRDRIGRIAAMTGLERAKVLKLDLSDFLGLEDASYPLLESLLSRLNSGGTGSETSDTTE